MVIPEDPEYFSKFTQIIKECDYVINVHRAKTFFRNIKHIIIN